MGNDAKSLKAYKFSKDYNKLKQLLDEGHEIICSVEYDFYKDNNIENKKPSMVIDLCTASKYNNAYRICTIHRNYIVYELDKQHSQSFEEVCAEKNVKFIEA